ncbi:hypothetical protein NIES593_09995 [Hydrococcus rivularis NIES-593]|uniref:Circadian input-output histidine kinase CikA n=1 Tax=Hydrococcus rivularis NIES-593 TaxID=1921803 RepID=A0A1U7HJ12_9CYAN|nr:PAS domain S-box protein [Hydrococcus rivularis]OKH23544.1 hypothetical protein NIES593_09995 [Hydrococcus rivularis NIES-593]
MKETLANQLNQLRTTLGKMEIALGTVNEAIAWTDSQGKVKWCNMTFDRLVNIPHISIIEKQLSELLPLRRSGQDVSVAEHPVNLALENRSKGRADYEFRDLILEISWSCLNLRHLSDTEQSEISVVLAIRDITESKRKEQALQQVNEELEKRVAERTQQLTRANQQLQQELAERRRVEAQLRATTSRLSALIQNLQAGILVENELGQIVLANQKFCQQFGIPLHPDMLIGVDCQRLAQTFQEPFFDFAQADRRIENILNDRPVATSEELLLRDGRIFERDDIPIWVDNRHCGKLWMYRDISDRKQLEAQLREREKRFRLLVTHAPVGIFQTDSQGHCLFVNPRWMELSGLSMAEALGTGWVKAIHPSDRELVFAEWYESARTERQFTMEYRFQTPAGKVNWVFGMAIAIRDEAGAIAGYFGTVTDITARKQAEQRLRESEERLRLALEAVEEGLWDWNPVTGKVYRSPRWATILGYSPDALENDIDWRDRLVHPDDKPYMLELLEAHLRGRAPYFEMELRMLTQSGEWKWILDRGQVVERDEQGQPLRMVGTHKDITERKRSEETLRKRYQQILLLKEIVAEIRQSLDLQKIFQTTAQRVGQALSVDRAIIYSYIEHPTPQLFCVAEYLTPDTNSLFDLSVPNAGDSYAQQVLSQDRAMVSDDIFAEATLEPIWNTCRHLNIKSMLAIRICDRDKPYGVLVLHQCNSVRHWERDEVEWLEAVAAQVGIALAQAQLLEREKSHREQLARQNQELSAAKKAADAANLAKSEFLATMSHEIRTPMNAVIGMAGLLLDTDLSPQQRQFAETIRSSSEALLVILNDILDFSKIESGKLELEAYPFEVQSCVEEALNLIVPKAVAKNLQVIYQIDPQVPRAIVGDITRVRQILVNLLGNAVKFTDAGEIRVAVTASLVSKAEQAYEIQFMVKDTGIGIAPQQQRFLFQSFSQANASVTRKYGGTGLGLAICKRLAKMMGGSIWMESHGTVAGAAPPRWLRSQENRDIISTVSSTGSTFYFTIAAKAAPFSSTLTPSDCQAQLEGKRILIVDDNPVNRELLTQLTQSWGMLPRAADSGSQALCWLRQGESFDLAILDLQMPKMNGIELAESIQALPECRALPLMMLTAVNLSPKELQKSTPVQFVAWLQNPVQKSQLYDTLVQIFWTKSVSEISALPEVAIAQRSSSNQKIETTVSKPFPLRILLAEDNSINQQVALLILQKLGYRADVAGNGWEAIRALRQAPYDVVLMDVEMPEMDGLTAAQRIAEEWKPSQRPWLIAVTAYAMKGDREKCLVAGMNDYISKPIRETELLQALEKAALRLEKDRANRQESQPQTHQAEDLILDAKVLDSIREMVGAQADEFIAHLIEEYLKTAPQYLEQIRDAIASSNLEQLRQSSHALGSSSATLGAVRFAKLCKQFENLARSGTLSNTTALSLELETQYQQTIEALEKLL